MKNFYESVAERQSTRNVLARSDSLDKGSLSDLDPMTDQQKVDHAAQSNGGIKWADILRGNSASKVMPSVQSQ